MIHFISSIVVCALLFTGRSSAIDVTECPTVSGTDESGHMLLQAKTSRSHSHQMNDECALPAGAAWCEVHLKDLPVYSMAVYAENDWVSTNICTQGHWEETDMTEFGAPGNLLDIGGNIGYHSFAFAAAGWNVTTFEPMAPNHALLNATLCKNPNLASRIHINYHGLGTSSQQCRMIAPKDNKGDGFARCGDAIITDIDENKFMEIGNFSVRRLDEVLAEQNISRVDAVKIDVEGYEGQVFNGAPNLLTQYHPRFIKSEVWKTMANATGEGYFSLFESSGYQIFEDNRCQKLYKDPRGHLELEPVNVVFCK